MGILIIFTASLIASIITIHYQSNYITKYLRLIVIQMLFTFLGYLGVAMKTKGASHMWKWSKVTH